MSDIKIPADLLTSVVDFVEGTGQVLAKKAEQEAEVNAQAKVTLDMLKKQGLAQQGVEDSALLTKLANPVEALKALHKTAALVTVPKLGASGGTEKAASMEKQSADLAFEQALGL